MYNQKASCSLQDCKQLWLEVEKVSEEIKLWKMKKS